MAYDPADLRLPPWLLRLFDVVVGIRWRLGGSWQLRLTRPGALYLSALIGVWAAAFYSANNLLYLCGAMLTSLALIGGWQGIRCLRLVPPLTDVLPDLSEVGLAHVLREPVKRSFGMSAWVEIQWSGEHVELFLTWRNSEKSLVTATMKAKERGLHTLTQQRLQTSAPLGLWELSCQRLEASEWLVLPAAVAWQTDHYGVKRLREGDEWRDLRAYVPGDPLSRVHWRKSTQNLSNWIIKRFDASDVEKRSENLRVDLRLAPQSDAQSFERLLGQVWYWLKEGEANRKLILGQYIFDFRDTDAYQQACQKLSQVEPEMIPPVDSDGLLLSLLDQS